MALVPYDDRDGVDLVDGDFVPWRSAQVHVLSHGLHYASAVFEGERAYSGNIFKRRAHSERLIASARILGFEIPWTASRSMPPQGRAVAKNGFADAYVRPIAWRGSEEMGVAAQQTKIHMAIAAWEWGAYYGASSG